MNSQQAQIIQALNIVNPFDVQNEISRRTAFMKNYLQKTGLRTLVLGISGGVDSMTAGALAQKAVNELRAQGYDARFIAMRLPYGVQADEVDAQAALEFIQPDQVITVNIKRAVDGMMEAISLDFDSESEKDFIKGNVKARQRMVAQYAVAGQTKGLVIGTDHASECVTSYFTKHGDGACDITPLTGLVKDHVRQIATALGAPEKLVRKTPTADLEDLSPQKPDEVSHGVSYDEIDAFLLGTLDPSNERARVIITKAYEAGQHKRDLPYSPFD